MSNSESSTDEVQGKVTVQLNEDNKQTSDENQPEVSKSLPAENKPKNSDVPLKSDKVIVGKNESLDSALRRFKRQSSGIISEVRKREAYDKPSVKRKKKSKEARRKNKKRSNYF